MIDEKWVKLTNKEIVRLLNIRIKEFDEMDFGYNCTTIFYGEVEDWWQNTLDIEKFKIIDGELYRKG